MKTLTNIGRVVAAVLFCFGSVAFAGEITGTGKSLKTDGTLNGASECAFSGLNDTYSGDPAIPDGFGFYRTQNWGQLPKETRDYYVSIGVFPGTSCNPSTY